LPKPLALVELDRRLKKLRFELLDGPDEHQKTFVRVLPPYFPYATFRKVSFPIPRYYEELEILPTAIVENILLHLFLTSEEEDLFWADEERVH
jgi:hypothetical protein